MRIRDGISDGYSSALQVTTSENSSGAMLEWLGFRGARGGRNADGQAAFENGAGNVFQQARRHLLDEIAAFLLTYELDVTPNNLLTPHGAFSGSNHALHRKSVGEGKSVTVRVDLGGRDSIKKKIREK